MDVHVRFVQRCTDAVAMRRKSFLATAALLCILSAASPAPTSSPTSSPTAVPTVHMRTNEEWSSGLEAIGFLRSVVFKIAKASLYVIDGIDTEENQDTISNSIEYFDSNLSALLDGNSASTIPVISTDWGDEVTVSWAAMKTGLVEGEDPNMSIVIPSAYEITDYVDKMMTEYIQSLDASGDGTIHGLRVNTALRQNKLIQEIIMLCLAVHQGIDPATSLISLEDGMNLFSDSSDGLLAGLDFVGLPVTVEKCTLQAMGELVDAWTEFKLEIQVVLFNSQVDDDSLVRIMELHPEVEERVNDAAEAYLYFSEDCDETPTSTQWEALLDMSSTQMMYGQKVGRLFLQAAMKVNTLDSRVLMSDSLVNGRSALGEMRAGSAAADIPSPVTQEVASYYSAMLDVWTDLNILLADNVQTVTGDDTNIIEQVEALSEQFYVEASAALDLVVESCILSSVDVQCVGLQLLGMQRVLLQEIVKFSALMGLNQNTEMNRAKMQNSSSTYIQNHYYIVHGLSMGSRTIPKITDYCLLQELKAIIDKYDDPYYEVVEDVIDGAGANDDNVLALDKAMWSAGIDPMNEQIRLALISYIAGSGTCTQVGDNVASRTELEQGVRSSSRVRELTQMMAREYAFELLKDAIGESNLTDWIDEFELTVLRLTSGWTAWDLPAPPTQDLVDSLISEITDNANWTSLKALLQAPQTDEMEEVSVKSDALLLGSEVVETNYVSAAWDVNTDVPGARSALSGRQLVVVEHLAKLAAMKALGFDKSSEITDFIQTFEANHDQLINGNELTGKDYVVVTSEDSHLNQMDLVWSLWEQMEEDADGELVAVGYKSSLTSWAEADGDTITPSQITTIESQLTSLKAALQGAHDLYSTMTLTDMTPINVMMPIPITGSWNPGPTMKIAAERAQDIINQQQKLLPGYELVLDFFDDQCDADNANRGMLEKYASSDQWVGVGGMGCNSVCESLAVIAASLFLPVVSFECSEGDTLSDSNLFPGFTRVGTGRSKVPDMLMHLQVMFGWDHLAIISNSDLLYYEQAELLQNSIPDFASTIYSVSSNNFDAVVKVMTDLVALKRRIIYFFGDENLFRQVICASEVAGTLTGLTWISEGIRSRSWWSEDDANVIAQSPVCDGSLISDLYEGALVFTGVGEPLTATDVALDCYEDYTSSTLHAEIQSYFADGYPATSPNRTAVDHPHDKVINYVVDGVCVFAKMVQGMLAQGYAITDLRSPTETVYDAVVDEIKQNIEFQGATGAVTVSGNDVLNNFGVYQISGTSFTLAGFADINGNINISASDLHNSSWAEAPPDLVTSEEEFPILAVVIPSLVLFFCAIVCCAACTGRAAVHSQAAASTET